LFALQVGSPSVRSNRQSFRKSAASTQAASRGTRASHPLVFHRQPGATGPRRSPASRRCGSPGVRKVSIHPKLSESGWFMRTPGSVALTGSRWRHAKLRNFREPTAVATV
jgi:hypothetical protein